MHVVDVQDRNCILADEMGLGKTVQCVSFLGLMAETVGARGPFLVVVPLSTVPNWIKEFRKWTPQVRAECHTTSMPRHNQLLLQQQPDSVPMLTCL